MNEPNDRDEKLVDILRPAIGDLEKYSKRTYEQLIQYAQEGFFEQHQSAGKIRNLADILLSALEEESGIDED